MAYFLVCLLNQRDCAVSYVRSVLQPNEKVLITGRLHWIVYIKAILFLIVGTALVALENNLPNGDARTYLSYSNACRIWRRICSQLLARLVHPLDH